MKLKTTQDTNQKQISADAGYNTEESANIAYKEDIELILPTRKTKPRKTRRKN